MLQLKNDTPFEATIYLMPDRDGIDSLHALLKGTFTLEESPRPADEQVPIVVSDEHYGDPQVSSIKTPGDSTLAKPGTDILLVGHAHSANGRAVTWMDVTLAVGPFSKIVRVFGDRFWQSDGVGASISEPEPFTTMPLAWERAYGGTDEVDGELHTEVRNPVGIGYRSPKSQVELHGLRVPNLEDPSDAITSPKQSPAPACFAPVAAHWEPRRSYAGTYDEAWQSARSPYLPDDFDPRFLQVAPYGLAASGYLRGGEPVEVVGASQSGPMKFRLPMLDVSVDYIIDGGREPRPANLDTVLIQPDSGQLIMSWRAVLPCDKKALRVSEIEISVGSAA